MPNNEQVRIDLVANDDASATIRDVADAVDKLEQADATVDVEVEDRQAKQSVDELIANVSKLDNESATVVLAIRDAQVQRQLTEVLETVERLDASDPQIAVELAHAAELRADVDALETKIRDLNGLKVSPTVDTSSVEDYASETGKAQDATHSFVGNAVAELPGVGDAFGPLGESVSQMTEGVLAGEIAFSQLVTAALPIAGITIGIKLLTDALARNRKRAEEAEKAAAGWRDAYINAIEDGSDATDVFDRKVRDFLKDNDDLPDVMDQFGVSFEDLAARIDGKASPSLDKLQGFVDKVNHAIHEGTVPQLAHDLGMVNGQALVAAADDAQHLIDKTNETTEAQRKGRDKADAYARAVGLTGDKAKAAATKVETYTEKVDAARLATEHNNRQLEIMAERLNMNHEVDTLIAKIGGMALAVGSDTKVAADDVLDIKTSIIQVATYAGLNPIEVQTILDKLDSGDYAGAIATVQTLANQGIGIPTFLKPPTRSEVNDLLASIGATIVTSGGATVPTRPTPGAAVVNVTQVFPRGFRNGSAIAEARREAQRAGGLYMRRHVP